MESRRFCQQYLAYSKLPPFWSVWDKCIISCFMADSLIKPGGEGLFASFIFDIFANKITKPGY